MNCPDTFDYLLIGGGLQSGLMALSVLHHQPQARVAIIERESHLGGNHTWSFHASDIPTGSDQWLEPLVQWRWPRYDVRVGGRQRTIELGYLSVSSEHFARAVTEKVEACGGCILTDTNVVELGKNRVTFGSGDTLKGQVTIDNRGPRRIDASRYRGGFQKFWGFEITLDADWPISNPIIMDDRIDQADGFRFVYSLPFSSRRVLVEDTRFSESPSLDRDDCLSAVRRYLLDMGCHGWQIEREESGVLPMPIGGVLPGAELPRLSGGYRGGWFHAATGYSFPLAALMAQAVGTTPADVLVTTLQLLAREQARRARFARFLNRLLFDLVKPRSRYQIFRRFYRVLDPPSIARFYGHRFTARDAWRIVVGVPPSGLRPIHFIRQLAASTDRGSSPTASTLPHGVST